MEESTKDSMVEGEERNTSSRSSSTMTENISFPVDILLDIIYRLPILCLPKDLIKTLKDLIKTWRKDESDDATRFLLLANKSNFVRRHWEQSLTTNPSVIALSPKRNRLFFAEDYTSYDPAIENDIDQETESHKYDYKVAGICHGLVCLTKTSYNHEGKSFDVYLWNPLTREQLRIECPSATFPKSWRFEVVFGFGCLHGAADYKVLGLSFQSGSYYGVFRSYASVYSLGTKSWRGLPKLSTVDDVSASDPGAMVNESLHWLAGVSHRYNRILSFDMKEETFKVMRIPFSCTINSRQLYSAGPSLHVMELGGQLCVYDNPVDGELQVWVMKEYGVSDSWTSLFKIGGLFRQLRPLGVANDGDIILKKNTHSFQQLMLYNAETKAVKKFKPFTHQHYDQAYIFTTSLITLTEQDKDGDIESKKTKP